MGQKVNPIGMRIGLNKDWNSRWYASKKDYSNFLIEDIHIREYLVKNVNKGAYISHIEIERKKTDKGYALRVLLFVGRASVVIGVDGAEINKIKAGLTKILGENTELKIDVIAVKSYFLDANVVALDIAHQLEERASFRIVQKRALSNIRKAGAKGCKTSVSGRLAGAEIARSEGYKEGTMAINTLRSDIDYAWAEAHTTYGKLGVKVWICRGEKLTYDPSAKEESNTTNSSNNNGRDDRRQSQYFKRGE